jgi:hypothetical protein
LQIRRGLSNASGRSRLRQWEETRTSAENKDILPVLIDTEIKSGLLVFNMQLYFASFLSELIYTLLVLISEHHRKAPLIYLSCT